MLHACGIFSDGTTHELFLQKKLTKWRLRILKIVKVELKIELSPFLFNFLIQNAIWLRLQPRLDYEFAPQYKKRYRNVHKNFLNLSTGLWYIIKLNLAFTEIICMAMLYIFYIEFWHLSIFRLWWECKHEDIQSMDFVLYNK